MRQLPSQSVKKLPIRRALPAGAFAVLFIHSAPPFLAVTTRRLRRASRFTFARFAFAVAVFANPNSMRWRIASERFNPFAAPYASMTPNISDGSRSPTNSSPPIVTGRPTFFCLTLVLSFVMTYVKQKQDEGQGLTQGGNVARKFFLNPGPWFMAAGGHGPPKFDESPRVGFQALNVLPRRLGSRDEQTPASACLADPAAGPAARCHPDVGTDGSATASARLRGGDSR
jgi:hypothetical protein